MCAQIIPWNFPLLMAAWKIAPALAAGCTVVLKPAEQTPLTALRLGELALEAGLPEGVLNVITGDGETGAALVDHDDVDKIAFTGSTVVGREIGAKAGRALKRVTLELGGKSPNIILPDADLDVAVKGAYQAIYYNTGQACNAGSRLFVHADHYDDVVSGLVEAAGAARMGPGLDPGTQLGPLISAEQEERVRGYIEQGKAEGAELVTGGGGPRRRRLLRGADPVQRDQRRPHDRPRGDLRARAGRPALRPRGGRSPRQRHRLRPRRRASGRATSPRRTSSPRCCAPATSGSTPGAPATRPPRSAGSRRQASGASTAARACTPTSRTRPSGSTWADRRRRRCEPRRHGDRELDPDLGLLRVLAARVELDRVDAGRRPAGRTRLRALSVRQGPFSLPMNTLRL